MLIGTQYEREQSCGYKPRRGVSWAGPPPPAYMCVASCSTEDVQSNAGLLKNENTHIWSGELNACPAFAAFEHYSGGCI